MPTSPLHAVHEAAGARFTDFGGWTMPVQYEGVLAEHNAVRDTVGVFDVSHLGRFEVVGEGATELLRSQLCNDIAKAAPGRAQYTMALNGSGGVEDDIIVWRLDDERFWVMPNGTTFDGIVERFTDAAPPGVSVFDVRTTTVLLAVQGPLAPDVIETVLGVKPGRFRIVTTEFSGHEVFAAGTGYTGERGGEICIPISGAEDLWMAIVEAGATPAALGAREIRSVIADVNDQGVVSVSCFIEFVEDHANALIETVHAVEVVPQFRTQMPCVGTDPRERCNCVGDLSRGESVF